MQLDLKDRLMLANQYRILSFLDKDSKSYYNKLIQILERGYEGLYSELTLSFTEPMNRSEITFVMDVLDLHSAIGLYVSLHEDDKEVKEHRCATFLGFAGNQETNYLGLTRYFINIEGKWSDLKEGGRDFNSHMPMLDHYKKMLIKWGELGRPYELTREQALAVLNV